MIYRTAIILLLFISLIEQGISQNILHKFGAIKQTEILLESVDYEPDAKAVVLFDIGKTRFDDSWILEYERTVRIKILKESGTEKAEISIPYYQKHSNSKEFVVDIEAQTFNYVNGSLTKTELNPENIYVEQRSKNRFVKKFALPDVKAGSIIEYRYKLISPYNYYLDDWEFQKDIPCLYSEYEIRMIPFLRYTFLLQGADDFDQYVNYPSDKKRYSGPDEYEEMVHKFIMKDIPSIQYEPYMTSIDDYRIKLIFQLAERISRSGVVEKRMLNDWSDFVKEFLNEKEFGGYLNAAERRANKLLDEWNIGDKPYDIGKARTIIELSKKTFKWNGQISKWANQSAGQFLDTKIGNSTEINLMLTALLRKGGIEAYPVMLSTRNNGKILTDYPFTSFFNTIIVWVKLENGSFLTDATDPDLAFNIIPINCINDKGIVIDKDYTWINLAQNPESTINRFISIELNETYDSLNAQFSTQAHGYEAWLYRRNCGMDENEFIDYQDEKIQDYISHVEIRPYYRPSEPYRVKYRIEMPVQKIQNKIFVKPLLNNKNDENPFKLEKRKFPVDFIFSYSEVYNSILNIPDSFEVENIPEPINIDDDLMTINISSKYDGSRVITQAKYLVKKPVYSTQEYHQLKDHFQVLIEKFNEPVILAEK
jgi:hypothetical protein